MFSTAFPKVPFVNFGASAEDGTNTDTVAETTTRPPVIPFDALVLAATAARSEEGMRRTAAHNAVTIARYESVAETVRDAEARDFLAALVFLGTRRVTPGS